MIAIIFYQNNLKAYDEKMFYEYIFYYSTAKMCDCERYVQGKGMCISIQIQRQEV